MHCISCDYFQTMQLVNFLLAFNLSMLIHQKLHKNPGRSQVWQSCIVNRSKVKNLLSSTLIVKVVCVDQLSYIKHSWTNVLYGKLKKKKKKKTSNKHKLFLETQEDQQDPVYFQIWITLEDLSLNNHMHKLDFIKATFFMIFRKKAKCTVQ